MDAEEFESELRAVLARLGQRLKHLRGGRTFEEAANASDKSVAYIKRIEKGVENPTIKTLLQLAKGYRTSMGEISKPWRQHAEVATGEDEMIHDMLQTLLEAEPQPKYDWRQIIIANVESVHESYQKRSRKKHR